MRLIDLGLILKRWVFAAIQIVGIVVHVNILVVMWSSSTSTGKSVNSIPADKL